MNTILEESDKMPFFTHLRVVFDALGGRQNEFKWLITDWECNDYPEPELVYTGGRPVIISGERLTEIVNNRDIQFIWGVLSGFKPNEPIDVGNLNIEPYADGNSGFWKNPPQIQHPKAIVEIVCWDSSLTLLLSKDNDLSVRFRTYFPEYQDLDEYNDMPVYDVWLKSFIKWSEALIPKQEYNQIQVQYHEQQFKTAFENLMIRLIDTGKYPNGFYYPRWKETALYYGLNSRLDVWNAFQKWGELHKIAKPFLY